jgi:hypothetical protein
MSNDLEYVHPNLCVADEQSKSTTIYDLQTVYANNTYKPMKSFGSIYNFAFIGLISSQVVSHQLELRKAFIELGNT